MAKKACQKEEEVEVEAQTEYICVVIGCPDAAAKKKFKSQYAIATHLCAHMGEGRIAEIHCDLINVAASLNVKVFLQVYKEMLAALPEETRVLLISYEDFAAIKEATAWRMAVKRTARIGMGRFVSPGLTSSRERGQTEQNQQLSALTERRKKEEEKKEVEAVDALLREEESEGSSLDIEVNLLNSGGPKKAEKGKKHKGKKDKKSWKLRRNRWGARPARNSRFSFGLAANSHLLGIPRNPVLANSANLEMDGGTAPAWAQRLQQQMEDNTDVNVAIVDSLQLLQKNIRLQQKTAEDLFKFQKAQAEADSKSARVSASTTSSSSSSSSSDATMDEALKVAAVSGMILSAHSGDKSWKDKLGIDKICGLATRRSIIDSTNVARVKDSGHLEFWVKADVIDRDDAEVPDKWKYVMQSKERLTPSQMRPLNINTVAIGSKAALYFAMLLQAAGLKCMEQEENQKLGSAILSSVQQLQNIITVIHAAATSRSMDTLYAKASSMLSNAADINYFAEPVPFAEDISTKDRINIQLGSKKHFEDLDKRYGGGRGSKGYSRGGHSSSYSSGHRGGGHYRGRGSYGGRGRGGGRGQFHHVHQAVHPVDHYYTKK